MKQYGKFAAIAAMAVAMTASCAKEIEGVEETAAPDCISMTVNGSIGELTKTEFGAPAGGVYPITWSPTSESVRVYERVDMNSWSDRINSVAYEPSQDLKTASFKVNIVPRNASRFDYYVVYPSTGKTYQIKNNDSPDHWLNTVRLGTNDTQTPAKNGVDKKFTFLLGAMENLPKQPSSLDVQFKHLLGYARMTVKNLPIPSTDTLSMIKISFNDRTYINGFIDYRVDSDVVDLTRSASSSTNSIAINPKNLDVNSSSFDVWFAVAPLTIAAGESMTFSFTTPGGDITKTVNVPDGKPMEFKRGEVLSFNIDMTGTSIPKKVKFDFSVNDGQLPSAAKTPNGGNKQYFIFRKLDQISGKAYTFYNAGGLYFGDGKNYTTLYDGSDTGYIGLPAIPGYKLSRIEIDRTNATGADVNIEVLSDIASGTAVTGKVGFPKGIGNPPAVVLSGTKENTVYYIHALPRDSGAASYVPVNTLILDYDVATAADAHDTDYDVFLLLGQSNMAGRGDTAGAIDKADCNPIPGVGLFSKTEPTVLYAAQPLLNMESTIRKGYNQQKFNLGGPFAQAVNKSTGKKVLLVVNARGGTSIESWFHDSEPLYFNETDGDDNVSPYLFGEPIPNFFDSAVKRAKDAMKWGRLRAVLWHQGEGNSSPEKAAAYMGQLSRFASELREALGMTAAELPFIVGELNYAYEGAENLNPVLNKVSESIPNSACVSAEGCESKSDNTHFSQKGLTLLGQRYAEKYLEMTK